MIDMEKPKYIHSLNISGITFNVCFRHAETIHYFREYQAVQNDSCECISVPAAEWDDWYKRGGSDNAYSEYSCLTAAVSDELLKNNRCIMHAVAFRYKDKAWLISGHSGVGKSTQVNNLQKILPGEFQVICGDRPVLEIKSDQYVIVHPSPWNGKENWKGAPGAVLGGIILLERGNINDFHNVTPRNAVYPVLTRLIFTGETEESIDNMSNFENRLLALIPVYQLTSNTVPESTQLLYYKLFEERS